MPRIRSDATDIAAQKILEKIENYQLSPGAVISDLELSKEFGMSRTPVREAIMTLLDSGILERTRTKVVVKAITLQDINEILDVRDAIEQKAIQVILSNGGLTHEQLQELNTIQLQMQENIRTGNFNDNFTSDNKFHELLLTFSKNQRLLDVYQRLSLQSIRLRWFTIFTPSRYTQTIEEHDQIIHALKQRDEASASAAIRNHLTRTKNNYEEIFNNSQWKNIITAMQEMK